MTIIPIKKFGGHIRWKGQTLERTHFEEIVSYLRDCLSTVAWSNPKLKPTNDFNLMLDFVAEFKETFTAKLDSQSGISKKDKEDNFMYLEMVQLRLEIIRKRGQINQHPSIEQPKKANVRRQEIAPVRPHKTVPAKKVVSKLRIPVGRYRYGIVCWNGGEVKIHDFGQIRAYLDDCLGNGGSSQPEFLVMNDWHLAKDLAVKLKWVAEKDLMDLGFACESQKTRQERKARIRAVKRIEKEIIKRMIPLPIPVDVVSWTFLPEGDCLGAQVNAYVRETQTKYKARRFDGSRLEKLMTLTPVRCAAGKEEFDGYMAFFFEGCSIAVLECAWEGNAIYIFPVNKWSSLSKLTKSELIESHQRELTRIIHDPNEEWFRRLKRMVNKKTSQVSKSKSPGRAHETNAPKQKEAANKAAKKKGNTSKMKKLPHI